MLLLLLLLLAGRRGVGSLRAREAVLRPAHARGGCGGLVVAVSAGLLVVMREEAVRCRGRARFQGAPGARTAVLLIGGGRPPSGQPRQPAASNELGLRMRLPDVLRSAKLNVRSGTSWQQHFALRPTQGLHGNASLNRQTL